MEELTSPQSTDLLVDFLSSVLPGMLEVESQKFRQILTVPQHQQALQIFSQEGSCRALIVSKDLGTQVVTIEADISYKPLAQSVGVIKREGIISIDSETGIASQVHIMTLYFSGDHTPFQMLISYLDSFNPVFGTYKARGEEEKSGVQNVQKKLAETKLALVQFQQTVEIPEVHLQVEPEIKSRLSTAESEGRKLVVDDFADKIQNTSFLNALQMGVNRWTKEIQKLTKQELDLSRASVLQEINFWHSLDKALVNVSDQLKSPEIEVTLSILKQAKRFHATTQFDTDTGLVQTQQKVATHNTVMKDFPVHELLSANTIEGVDQALQHIFNHMKKIRHSDTYPIQRAQQLVQSVSRDFNQQLLKILYPLKLMTLNYLDFQNIKDECNKIFSSWDEKFKEFKEMIKQMKQRRGHVDKWGPGMQNFQPCEHENLKKRISEIYEFRKNYEKLRDVIQIVFTVEHGEQSEVEKLALQEIEIAYSNVVPIDVLDLTKEGQESWENAQKAYEARIDKVESQITAILRDKLGTAKNANEMFKVFQQFNALFYRQRIQNAIKEYQSQLIAQVKADIELLQEKFKKHYKNTQASKTSMLKGLPEVAGQVIWAKQIEIKLDTYMKRVQDVLGKDWMGHPEGKKLKEQGDNFRKKLDMHSMTDQWIKQIEQYQSLYDSGDLIFKVVSHRGKSQDVMELKVNFDPEVIDLFKEVRNLNWLGIKTPYTIKIKGDEIKVIYPYAMSLSEAVSSYSRSCKKLDINLINLVANQRQDIQKELSQGLELSWSMGMALERFTKKLVNLTQSFEDSVAELLEKVKYIEKEIEELNNVELDVLQPKLQQIQKYVDDLNLQGYSNLEYWVQVKDVQIEEIFVQRIKQLLKDWAAEFEQPEKFEQQKFMDTLIVHQIQIKDQVLYLDPSLEQARGYWFKFLHTSIDKICQLQRISAVRFELTKEDENKNYRDIYPKISIEIADIYQLIDKHLQQAENYISAWLGYQALWDIQAQNILSELGDDLPRWRQLLTEIKSARTTFDSSETEKHFGAVVVDYRAVQAKVSNKYDQWHKDILNRFGNNLDDRIKQLNVKIHNARTNLEKYGSGPTDDVTELVTQIQELRKTQQQWQSEMDEAREGQRLLERQRFQFPND